MSPRENECVVWFLLAYVLLEICKIRCAQLAVCTWIQRLASCKTEFSKEHIEIEAPYAEPCRMLFALYPHS